MRRFMLAVAALAALSCSQKPQGEAGANGAAAAGTVASDVSPGLPAGFPELDSAGYCAKVSAGAGGMAALENSCKEQEAAARKDALALTVAPTILSYCAKSAKAAGSSYQIFKLCVEREKANSDIP